MQCPGDANHRGVKFILAPRGSDHEANMLCNECGAWIKNVSFRETEAVMSSDSDGIDEATEEQETDVERMERYIEEAKGIHARCISKTVTEVAIERVLQIAFKLYDGREKQ